ncbi:hypothetical protein ACQ5SO_14480 [Rhodovulum sp. DZ06]|uniref:hypothetical protein n=1 Tax=Rhodovulum sp. DZ06 TaxID=3425126 RepID=UPI003D350D47
MRRAGALAGLGALAASAAGAAGEAAQEAAQKATAAAPATDYYALWIKEGPGWWPLLFLVLLALAGWRRPEMFSGLRKFSGFGVEIEREVEKVEAKVDSEVGRVEDETLAMAERVQALEAQVAALGARLEAAGGGASAPAPSGTPSPGAGGGGSARGLVEGASRHPRVHIPFEEADPRATAGEESGGGPGDADPAAGSPPETPPPPPDPFAPDSSAPDPFAPAPAPPPQGLARGADATFPGGTPGVASPTAPSPSPSPASAAPAPELRALLDAALGDRRFTWRSLDRLALETGRPGAELHRILAEDPAYTLGEGAGGRIIARLTSRTPPAPTRRKG